MKSVRDLVRKQRGELYASGHQNLNMALPSEVIAWLDAWKSRYRLGSRDAVVARVIRQCMATTVPCAFVLHAKPPVTDMRRISPIVATDLADYVKSIQDRFHGIAYGPVFEMIVAQIGAHLRDDDGPVGADRRRRQPVPELST